MTVPKEVVKEYLDQLDRIDALESRRKNLYDLGDFTASSELRGLLQKEDKVLQELRQALVKAAG